MLVADNLVTGAGRHGLIASTEVRDVLFRANESRANRGSGLVVHGNSARIAAVDNLLADNHGSGLAVYEGRDVLVRDNRITRNRDCGIRVRNGVRVVMAENLFEANRPAHLRVHATPPGGLVVIARNRFAPEAVAEIGSGPLAVLSVFANAPPLRWEGERRWTEALARLGGRGGTVYRPDAGITPPSGHTMEWGSALAPAAGPR